MINRGSTSQNIFWDVENRVTSISGGASFVYDGDGNRVKKIENGVTTVYINQYYEKNITSGEVTSHYYLGSKEVAQCKGISPNFTLSYMMQDSLGSTSVISDSSGNSAGTLRYFPFGVCRFSTGNLPTDKLFTGQRRDISTSGSELYYYGARYYDPQIGRFISPDTIVPYPDNPQSLNRYSYCRNNPLKLIDPSGHLDGDLPTAGDITTWPQPPPTPGAGGNGSGGTNPSLPVTNQPVDTKPPEPAKPVFNNDVWAVAGGICVGLAADDATGVGVVDDVVIPAVAAAAVIVWGYDNRDAISATASDVVSSVTNTITDGLLWFKKHTKNARPSTWDKDTKRDLNETGEKRILNLDGKIEVEKENDEKPL